MKRLSDEAFAVMAICEETKKYFGITVDKVRNGGYQFVWSFPIDKEKAHREGYDSKSVNGSIEFEKEFPGCPYCKSMNFYQCPCGVIVCYHGQEQVTCPNCGGTGTVHQAESFNLKGGGY